MIKIETTVAKVNQAIKRMMGGINRKVQNQLLKRSAVKFIRLVVPDTPVDTGYLRAGWTALLRLPVTGPKVKRAKVSQGRREARERYEEGPLWILLANPAEYGLFIEEGTRHMPGKHMVTHALRGVLSELQRKGLA